MKKRAKTLNKKKGEIIEIKTLIRYYVLFIIPLIISFFVSWQLSNYLGPKLDMASSVLAQLFMLIFTFITFSILLPYVRKRENVHGVRLALIGFFLFSFFLTLPSLIKGYWGMILIQFLYFANYVLITFIFCPEVLGIHKSLEAWFKKSKQVHIVILYLVIVLLYCAGFAWVFFQLATDPVYPGAFDLGGAGQVSYGTFFYFSIITFAAIGYGDISPLSSGARLVSCVEGIIGMVINVVFIAILLMYISNVQTIVHQERRLAKDDRELKEKEAKLEREIKKLEKKKKRKSRKKKSN
jgi:hypothetical protein